MPDSDDLARPAPRHKPPLKGGSDPTRDHVELDPDRLAARAPRTDPAMAKTLDGVPEIPPPPRPLPINEKRRMESLCSRPPGHTVLTPEAVDAAWEAVVEVGDRFDELVGRFEQLDAIEGAAARQLEADAYEAVAAGKDVPAPVMPDHKAERNALNAQARALLRLAADRRRAYDAVVDEHQPAWRSDLVDAFTEVHDDAVDQTNALRKTLARRDAIFGALRQANEDLDDAWDVPRDFGMSLDGVLPKARKHTPADWLDAIHARLTHPDPAISGMFLTEKLGYPTLPAYLRRHIDQTRHDHRPRLAEVERAEGYAHTAYTRPKKSA